MGRPMLLVYFSHKEPLKFQACLLCPEIGSDITNGQHLDVEEERGSSKGSLEPPSLQQVFRFQLSSKKTVGVRALPEPY